MQDGLWDVRRTAAYLDVSPWWIYTSAAKGSLPSLKIGRSVKFRPADIEAWLVKAGRPQFEGDRPAPEHVGAG